MRIKALHSIITERRHHKNNEWRLFQTLWGLLCLTHSASPRLASGGLESTRPSAQRRVQQNLPVQASPQCWKAILMMMQNGHWSITIQSNIHYWQYPHWDGNMMHNTHIFSSVILTQAVQKYIREHENWAKRSKQSFNAKVCYELHKKNEEKAPTTRWIIFCPAEEKQ